MATNNSSNQQYSNESDGFKLSGGTTKRQLSVTGANIAIVGSGTNTYTFPASTDTLVGRNTTDTLTNKTIDGDDNTITNIGPSSLNTGANSNIITTSQSSSDQTFGDLSTVGPSVTVTIGANGLALVSVASLINQDTSGSLIYMSFALSGANTLAASNNNSLIYQAPANNRNHQGSFTILLTGLSAGSTTFTAKYRVNANTGTWSNRIISVVPL